MAAKEVKSAEVPKNVAQSTEKAEPVFTKSDLIKSAAVFGTTVPLMTGALYSVQKEKLTRQEAREALNAFLKRPVRKENN